MRFDLAMMALENQTMESGQPPRFLLCLKEPEGILKPQHPRFQRNQYLATFRKNEESSSLGVSNSSI